MVTPVCPKCTGTSFEAIQAKVQNLKMPYLFICCSKCGAAVGVTESHHVGWLVKTLADKLRVGPLKNE